MVPPCTTVGATDANLGQRGFTLVELMVAMVVSSILIAFLFGTTFRLASAFRVERQVTSVQQTLRTASALMSTDLRQAGFLLPNGFYTAAFGTPTELVPPIEIINDADGTGPDHVRLYYADGSINGRVTSIDSVSRQYADVANPVGFTAGDLAVLSNSEMTLDTDGNVTAIEYLACVVRLTAVGSGDPARIEFAGDGEVNTSSNEQCADVALLTASEGAETNTTLHRLIGRSYRIDPDRKNLSVLQGSPSGELVDDDWTDLAIGVTNLQLASRYHEVGDLVDADGDGDPTWDWYSSENQEKVDTTASRALGGLLAEVSLSLESRTTQPARGLPSTQTASFIDVDAPTVNALGDWAAVDLATTADSERPEAYRGSHVYRFSTVRIDLRNLAVPQ